MRKIRSVHQHMFRHTLHMLTRDIQDLVEHYEEEGYPCQPFAENLAKQFGLMWDAYSELCVVANVNREGKPLPDEDEENLSSKGEFGLESNMETM
jgi:hypothetical protein